MNNDKLVSILNTLIEVNNDRIQGYATASKETAEADLLALFSHFTQTSEHCNEKLSAEVYTLGGTPTEGTKNAGKFFRTWMDVKVALTSNDRKAILNSCEFGEDHAVRTYEEVLKEHADDLSIDHDRLINAQYVLIKADHDKVKSIRDLLVEQD